MPSVGLGTWQMTGEDANTVIRDAVDAGYRHIDTATLYQNEIQIGDALADLFAEGKIKREDIFITTKAFCHEIAPNVVESSLRNSLKRLRLDHVDLYLAHIPAATNDDGTYRTDVKVEDIWKGFENLYNHGLTRSIGVSNFSNSQLERIIKIQTVPVHVSQLELHLYLPQKAHRALCKKHNIVVTAYSTLGSPGRMNVISSTGKPLFEYTKDEPNEMEDEAVIKLAKKYNKTPAQILLRGTVEMGISVIPKSTNKLRLRENIDIFDFIMGRDDVNLLDARSKEKQARLFWWPSINEHPEDPLTFVQHFLFCFPRSSVFKVRLLAVTFCSAIMFYLLRLPFYNLSLN
uniref:Aldo_ket_red domain-containing protein n=1 Tax=Caenorhabditis japonica TaxID=281687 RepID=A0A8R1HU99_CAEJA